MRFEKLVGRNIRELVPYEPGKPIEDLQREYGLRKAVKLASNENPLGPSPLAVKALRRKSNDLHWYPDGDCHYLKQAISSWLNVKKEEILVGNGSNEIIELIIRTFLQPGEKVVVSEFAFIVYELITRAAMGEVVAAPSKAYGHDLSAMAKAVDSKTKIVFVANPNNPTGTYNKSDEVEKFLKSVPKNVLVVMDEAYFEYVREKDYPDSLQYLPRHPNLIVLRTFSKIFGLAGLRVGYGIARADVVGLVNRVRQPFNVNSIGQAAATSAIHDDRHIRKSVELNEDGKVFLYRRLARMGLEAVPSAGNFLLIRVGNGREIFKKLLPKGVIVRPLDPYRLPEFIRATVSTMGENRKFLRALEQVL
jgi:histidinol-phosphate aminotransferase